MYAAEFYIKHGKHDFKALSLISNSMYSLLWYLGLIALIMQ